MSLVRVQLEELPAANASQKCGPLFFGRGETNILCIYLPIFISGFHAVMKYSLKNKTIWLFRRIDKAVFDVHRTGRAWKNRKVPHWIVLVLALGSYFFLIWQLWPFLSNSEIPFLRYSGIFLLLVFTILFLVFAKIYISQLLNYTSPYPIKDKKSHLVTDDNNFGTPFRFSKMAHRIDYENAGLFMEYLKTDRDDYLDLLGESQSPGNWYGCRWPIGSCPISGFFSSS